MFSQYFIHTTSLAPGERERERGGGRGRERGREGDLVKKIKPLQPKKSLLDVQAH